MSTFITPAAVLKDLNGQISGLNTLPAGSTIVITGVTMPVVQLIAELEGYKAVYDAVPDAQQKAKSALQARNAAAPQIQARCAAGREAIKGMLGRKNPGLAKFGMEPDKDRPPRTVEQKQIAKEKNLATRKARGTRGPKQKAAIHGTPDPATTTTSGTSTTP